MRKIISEIYLQNIQNNAKAFARWTGKPVCAVVKADAYGHGAVEVVNALQSTVKMFAVSLLDEALAIRAVTCGKEVLILTPPCSETEVRQAVVNGFCITVDTLKTARLAVRSALFLQKPLKVHLKVNTGMNRYGMNAQTLGKTCAYLRRFPFVEVLGLYSHFYGNTPTGLETQYSAFLRLQTVCKRYYKTVVCHISATYGSAFGKRYAGDMVRIGLGLYGYLPDGTNGISETTVRALHLQPAMRVYAQVSASRIYQNGGAGYGKPLKKLGKGTDLHVLRFGYADGFLRRDGYGLSALCMDACVREGKARVGTFVLIMDNAQTMAKRTGTVSYEVLCAMNRRAERVYTYGKTAFCRKRRKGRKRNQT